MRSVPGERRDRRAGDAHTGKGSKTEDQAGIQHQVNDVRHPEQPHCDSGVAGAAKDRVVEKQQQHNSAATQNHSGVAGTNRHDLLRRAH